MKSATKCDGWKRPKSILASYLHGQPRRRNFVKFSNGWKAGILDSHERNDCGDGEAGRADGRRGGLLQVFGRGARGKRAAAAADARRVGQARMDGRAAGVAARERGVARQVGAGAVHGAGMVATRISIWRVGGNGDFAAERRAVRGGVSRGGEASVERGERAAMGR